MAASDEISTAINPKDIAAYFDRLWPLLRSLTGDGVRKSHDILAELLPLERHEIPSGTACHDWTVPDEWKVNEAYVIDPAGNRILDVKDNNLHLVNYARPFRGRMTLSELDKHLHSLPEQPDAIPYVTSYYQPEWGFCLPHEQRQSLPEGEYEVVVDTELFKGSMTISDVVLKGETDREIFFSTYTCHPSMANNELSGPLVTAFLYRRIKSLAKRHYTYRFIFGPETIGAIAYLSEHGDHFKNKLAAGYVVNCVGTDVSMTYKKSRQGDTLADRAAAAVLAGRGPASIIRDFWPSGSDERQYCSPGYDLPVGLLLRSVDRTYPEYHTSLDNRDFISFEAMSETIEVYLDIVRIIESNARYESLIVHGEPFYSKHGLAPTKDDLDCLQWLVSMSDGVCDLIDISLKSGLSVPDLRKMADLACDAGLLHRKDTA